MSWERTLADLVEERTGIALAPRQLRSDVRRHAEKRVAALGLHSPQEWVWQLAQSPRESEELTALIEAVTVGYSYFFRDAGQLDVVVEVLEELRRGLSDRQELHVWCAGCSTGQEAWSVAILAESAGLPVRILATDINNHYLKIARTAEYSEKEGSRIPDSLRGGLEARGEGVRVRDELHERVRFARHNLVSAGPYPAADDGEPFHLILCRNVFIYFSDGVRQRVATRLSRQLAPRGWLFFGPGESLEGLQVPVVARPWGRRLGYCPAPVGGPLRPERAPTPLPPRRVRGPVHAASDPLDVIEARALHGDLEGAEADLMALAERTGDARTWTALAHVRIRLHWFDEALFACHKAQEADPLLVDPNLAEGLVHRKLGDLGAAERAFRQALFLDEHQWVAALLLAGVYARQGRDRERRVARRRATRGITATGAALPSVPLFGVDDLDRNRVREHFESEIGSR